MLPNDAICSHGTLSLLARIMAYRLFCAMHHVFMLPLGFKKNHWNVHQNIQYSCKAISVKMTSAKYRPFRSGLNVWRYTCHAVQAARRVIYEVPVCNYLARDSLHMSSQNAWALDSRGLLLHGDVIKWKHVPRYWPFMRGIHRSPVDSPHKGQWRGALVHFFICAWTNGG